MQIFDSDRRLARDMLGLGLLDRCPVVVIRGPGTPRLVGEVGHYVDLAGHPIHTQLGMRRAGPGGRRYVPETRSIVVGAAWVVEARREPYDIGSRRHP